MLTIFKIKSAAAACRYYGETPGKAQYYQDKTEEPGLWGGLASDFMQMRGQVETDQFVRLAANQHPGTGSKLTKRTNPDRLVGWDMTFAVPKTVTLAYVLGKDERVRRAVERALDHTMRRVEDWASARVRKDGRQDRRRTENLIWAKYCHKVTRPERGVPDPHLHYHVVVFNSTWDSEERQWKALDFKPIWDRADQFQTYFFAKVARGLTDLGYRIVKTEHAFDIEHLVPFVERFSNRSEAIEKLRAKLGITSPKQKARLGATSRERKRRNVPWDRLQDRWQKRLTDAEVADVIEAGLPNTHSQRVDPGPEQNHQSPKPEQPEQPEHRDHQEQQRPRQEHPPRRSGDSGEGVEHQQDPEQDASSPDDGTDRVFESMQTHAGPDTEAGAGAEQNARDEHTEHQNSGPKESTGPDEKDGPDVENDFDEQAFRYRTKHGEPSFFEYQQMKTTGPARKCVKAAVGEILERDAVASLSTLRESALRAGMGKVTPEEAVAAIFQHPGLVSRVIDNTAYFTTREALEEEISALNFIKRGQNACAKLGPDFVLSRGKLGLREWDRKLLSELMASRDRVTTVKYAGTSRRPGFSIAALDGLWQAGHKSMLLGASHRTCRAMEKRYLLGRRSAQTVHSYIAQAANPKPGRKGGHVLWVEDAGSLGMRTTSRLLKAAEKQRDRVILLGDEQTSRPWERGNPYALFRHEGIRTIERRLKDEERDMGERDAHAFTKDPGDDLVVRLQARQQVSACGDEDGVISEAAERVFESLKDKKRSVLAVGPTQNAVDALTAAVRERLRAARRLGKRDKRHLRLDHVFFGQNTKTNLAKLEAGMIVDFRRNHFGFKSGQRTRITKVMPLGQLVVEGRHGGWQFMPFNPEKMTVSRVSEMNLARHDRIRATLNGTDINGRRIRKDQAFEVERLMPGRIVTKSGHVLRSKWGHIEHGWATRHNRVLGREADDVVVFAHGADWKGLGRESFHTAMQAHRQSFHCVVDSTEHLAGALDLYAPRPSAMDLTDRPDQLKQEFNRYHDWFKDRREREQAMEDEAREEELRREQERNRQRRPGP